MMKLIKIMLLWLIFGQEMSSADRLGCALELATLLPIKVEIVDKKIKDLLGAKPGENGVITVPVLQQGFFSGWPGGAIGSLGLTWADVRQDDAANCGYHALKNVLFLLNAIQNKSALFLQYLESKQAYFDCMSMWAPMIYIQRGYQAPVNWLQGQELDYLKDHLERLLKVPIFSNLSLHVPIVITEDVRSVGQAVGLPVNETMLQPIRALSLSESGILGVVWSAGHGGHWVGFVVFKQEGILKIYYMNSCASCPANLKQATELFSMTTEKIDGFVLQNQKMNMLQDLISMKRDLQIMSGEQDSSIVVYPEFIGCVQRKGSMFERFTIQDLIKAGFSDEKAKEYELLINKTWQAYLKKDVESKMVDFRDSYLANISANKERLYGFWIDKNKKTGFVINISANNCEQAKQKYYSSMLILDAFGQTSFFDLVEKTEAIFDHILVGWQNNQLDIEIQKELVDVLQQILVCFYKNPVLFKAMKWKEFGEGKTKRAFAGFKHVMDVIVDRIKTLPGFDEQKFRKNYIDRLLKL